MKLYLIIAAITVFLSSCLKQSIPDAMLGITVKGPVQTATMNYEINGNPVAISVMDADNQLAGSRRLYCEKSSGYLLSGLSNYTEFLFTFYTDSLIVGNYKYTSSYGHMYVTTFEGKPQYVYSPGDYLDFNVSSYKDGHISGNFSGQLTPAISQGYPNNIYGTPGSVVIKNGSFNNVPVFY
jgi:hypothetical protein